MPRISFILPVYNMEEYLPRVAESLKKQTMGDFEAIFVNDGSKDRSGEICAELEKEDSRFRVISKPNGGVASARNTALDLATGDYLFFLDPDDWIEAETAEILTETADRERADIVMFGKYNDFYDEKGKCVKSVKALPPITGVFCGEPFKEYFDKLATSFFITTKLMRREFVERYHLRFPAKSIGEDGLFYVEFYRHNPSCLVVIDRPLYHYTEARSNSLSNSYHPERVKENFYLSSAIRSVVEEWGLMDSPLHRAKVAYCILRDLQLGIKNISLGPMTFGERYRWLRDAMRDSWVKRSVREVPLKTEKNRNDKIKLQLLKCHLYGAVLILSGCNQKKRG